MRNKPTTRQSIKEAFQELDHVIKTRKGRHLRFKPEEDGKAIKELFRTTRKGVLQ